MSSGIFTSMPEIIFTFVFNQPISGLRRQGLSSDELMRSVEIYKCLKQLILFRKFESIVLKTSFIWDSITKTVLSDFTSHKILSLLLTSPKALRF